MAGVSRPRLLGPFTPNDRLKGLEVLPIGDNVIAIAPPRRATTQTPPRNFPGSCPQREPKSPKATYVRSANF